MVDTEAATCAAPAVKRRRKNADPRVIVAGVLALLESVLSQFLNPDKVDAALEKAKELPAVKAMLDLQNCDGSSSGPCLLRSAYNAFVQDFVNKVKAGGVESSLQQAAGIWSVLPEEKKKEIHSRYTGIMKAYNAQISAGAIISLADVIAAYEKDSNLQPIDHLRLWHDLKATAAAAAAAKAAAAAASEGKETEQAAAAACDKQAVKADDGKRRRSSKKEKKRRSKKGGVSKRKRDKEAKRAKRHKPAGAADVV